MLRCPVYVLLFGLLCLTTLIGLGKIRLNEYSNKANNQENKQLYIRNQQLEAENKQLKATNQQLKEDNEQLGARNWELTKENEQFSRTNQQLNFVNQEISRNIENLKMQVHSNNRESARYKQLGDETEQLRKQLQTLKKNQVRHPNFDIHSNWKNKNKSLTLNLSRITKEEFETILKKFSELVTIILYQDRLSSLECVKDRRSSLQKMFPNITVLIPDSIGTVGRIFNALFPLVKTKCFLFLDANIELADPKSDHSVGWLLHALINIPELDFVSGSTLNNNRLEVPCYSFLLCNWTISQRYEYSRSVGELMICENIASSFMGKTSSISDLFGTRSDPFDAHLRVLVTTDFFLRAKQKGAVVAVQPEVIYKTVKQRKCSEEAPPEKSRERFQDFLPFAKKHKVFKFKDADSNVLSLCTSDSPIAGEDICDETVASKAMLDGKHWAYQGTFSYPYIIENLQHGLNKIVDFFENKNLPYFVDAGVALGAVKFRGILPWEAGDIDIIVFIESREKLLNTATIFADTHGYSVRELENQVQIFAAPRKIGMKMGGLISLFPSTGQVPDSLDFIKMKSNGKWMQCQKAVFKSFRERYGVNYLQHRVYASNKAMRCLQKGHNACLPDFESLGGLKGTAGTSRKYFCES